jgi:hypothetical protein
VEGSQEVAEEVSSAGERVGGWWGSMDLVGDGQGGWLEGDRGNGEGLWRCACSRVSNGILAADRILMEDLFTQKN